MYALQHHTTTPLAAVIQTNWQIVLFLLLAFHMEASVMRLVKRAT